MIYQFALSWSDMKYTNVTYMNCNERIKLMQFLVSYDDDDEYTRVRPYDLQ